ncbi:MAG: CinA family nicotinamide mononucleotide deamidase-related protein [Candidatus Marinimicrobia bacterium]|nr:CinA family nicotinamide mononucleotide deamidase-related protein [Candidatus Neomarinimicrobiota bacterium]
MGRDGLKEACIITIGDELLQGYTVDTNSAWLGKKLNNYNIRVQRKITIADELDIIQYELSKALDMYDLIFVTGGLGPTLDDVTQSAIKNILDAVSEFDENYYTELKQKFAAKKMEMPPNNRSQAMVINGTKVIPNSLGTARGIHIEKEGRHLFSLPGVPTEMKGMFNKYIVKNYLPSVKKESIALIRTTGIIESNLAEILKAKIDEYSDRYSFSFLPKFTGVDFKIRQDAPCELGLDSVSKYFFEWLSPYAYGWENETLESVLATQLAQKGLTLSVAESCTGGLIGKRLTDVEGSSSFFLGGIIAYSNDIKINQLSISSDLLMKDGAVSHSVAKVMAQSIQTISKSDISVATTGISGPAGGSDKKPVGLVYIAVSYNGNVWVKEFNFFPKRLIHREITSQTALNMVRKVINE